MDEDSGVKAPVTRLRRRLSVEQSEDVAKSPGPATPKKRGGRLVAKPQLELIDEHGANLTPSKRTTRKTSVKEAVEAADEKPITPSRRSTRIKSNTSIVSETTQSYDSPRAKRAARRTSQVGSDSESTATPIRQTRRTRKDSASSVEKLEITLSGKPNITEIIIEEESMSVKSDDTVKGSTTSPVPTRKSPRLRGKQANNDRKSLDKSSQDIEITTDTAVGDQLNESKQNNKKERKSLDKSRNEDEITDQNTPEEEPNDLKQMNDRKSLDHTINHELNSTKDQLNDSKQHKKKERKSIEKPNSNHEMTNGIISECGDDSLPPTSKKRNSMDHSVKENKDSSFEANSSNNTKSEIDKEHPKTGPSDSSLLEELDRKPKKKSSIVNKSSSALDNTNSFQSKRQRTKSWTMSSLSQDAADGVFYSDNEATMKKLKKRTSKGFQGQQNHTGAGDSENNDSINKEISNDKSKLNASLESSLHAKTTDEISTPNKSKLVISESISPQGNKENIPDSTPKKLNESAKFFEKAPTPILQSTVYYEDSDADSKAKEIVVMQLDTEDQCVPVIDKQLVQNNSTKLDGNNSILSQKNVDDDGCEPMDIDETIPNNVSLTEFSKENPNTSSNKKEQSLPSSPLVNNSLNKSSNKSKRKSSLSNTQNLEKSETENKSTLILSQLKDVSSTEHSVSKSPKTSSDILSKSVSCIEIVKDKMIDKINLSQDYSTSTPLQQKKMKKLGMQINSSIINSPNIDMEQSKQNNTSKKEISQISKPSESSSEEDSDLEDEESLSKDKSKFLENEAEEASDDYESGDSRDDDDRQYEDENEIVEKGETLDSDDDVSNDTDYEKDSFVVSSDEEDNELLSGSGDDLSMSDNELSMNKKSKKKYDQRKIKEQKKASREMYEARHQLNDSKATSKSTKGNRRQQIESSSEDSEEDIVAPVKKNKNLRLDSTHEDDLDKSNKNLSLTKKKSKAKRLSESVCDESATQEKEISAICDDDEAQSNDPLSNVSLVQIKHEPKTPMKDLNISTVQINENIEEVQVDGDVSMKANEGIDPLQATMLGEEDSSMSENSDITNNYDSVLIELNKASKTKTVKSLDTSLNPNKKDKKRKEPIIDQLNLTSSKGRDVVDSGKLNKSQNKQAPTAEDSSSSDSIDLQLLFSEDSTECDDSKVKINTSQKANDGDDVDDFIPLKRTPGKTNILAGQDVNETTPSESAKKKNKKRKSQGPTEELNADTESNDIQIIIDTQGTHESTNTPCDVSLNTSMKKKKNRNSVTFHDSLALDVATVDDEAPVEISSAKKNKKNRKSTDIHEAEISLSNVAAFDDAPEEISFGSAKKKKNRKSAGTDEDEVSLLKVAASDNDDAPEEISFGSSKKKKNRKSEGTYEAEVSLSKGVADKSLNVSLNTSVASKKKKRVSESLTDQAEEKDLSNHNISLGSSKKLKNKNQSLISEDNVHESSLNTSVKSAKKMKRLSETVIDQEQVAIDDEKVDKNISIGSAKKQKSSKDMSATGSAHQLDTSSTKTEDTLSNSKKRKRMSSQEVVENIDNNEEKCDTLNTSNKLNASLSDSRLKKKRKVSQNEDNEDVQAEAADIVLKKKNKKRKNRDDDIGNAVTKIFKENSFDNVHVPRLPASLINDLEEQPRKEFLESKKSSLISTTAFVVEDTRKRRNKPSKFLEESVYLNDDHIEKKLKANIKKPKVLPFIPTAVTSGSGFTTSFKINIIPQEVQFVAQTKNVSNFKNEYLYGKKIKRLGTYETLKKHRNAKMSKF